MNVTLESLPSVIDQLQKNLPKCLFVSVDTEFTGLGAGFLLPIYFDSIEDRYEKMVKVARKYSVIQFGMTLFFEEEEGKIQTQTFIFYTYNSNADNDFIVSIPTANFLVKNNFSFDTLIQQGLSFMRKSEEEEYRAKLLKLEDYEPVELIGKHLDFANYIIQLIQNWLNDTSVPLMTKDLTSFQRRIVYQIIREKFPYIWAEIPRSSYMSPLVLIHMGDTSPEFIQNYKNTKREEKILKAIGFRKVIDIISQSKIPVIGHNMFYDLVYIFEHYWDPLPAKWNDFRAQILNLFPILIDTKFLIPPSKDTLEQIFKQTNSIPSNLNFISYDKDTEESAYSLNKLEKGLLSSHAHNAGYDSWMTGIIFIKYFEQQKIERTRSAILKLEWINKLSITSSQKIIDLNQFILEPEKFYLFDEQLAYYINGSGIGEGYTGQNLLQRINMGQCSLKKINPDKILFILLENKALSKEEVFKKITDQNPKLIVQTYNQKKEELPLPEVRPFPPLEVPPTSPPLVPPSQERSNPWPIILLSSGIIIMSLFVLKKYQF